MKIPTIEGVIDRRILINFTVDAEVLNTLLPTPFTPLLVDGKGLAGICLIRLKNIRPFGLPEFLGIGSENAAHRIAVQWPENGEIKTGVYIPRRDTNSFFNHLTGGRVFPGVHHMATFQVNETANVYDIQIQSADHNTIAIVAKETTSFNPNSIFDSLESASEFFKNGAIGFSPNKTNYDGLELRTSEWRVSPLQVESVKSSFFENGDIFPKGTVTFDNALLMKNIQHTWHNYENQ